jgi:hypothetical protein
MPAADLSELVAIDEAKGLSSQTAAEVAAELTAHDALAARVEAGFVNETRRNCRDEVARGAMARTGDWP